MRPGSEPRSVTFLITSYNYGEYLGEAIDSALEQDHPSVEVVVVDDGSTDGSRDVIASYGNRIVPVLQENAGQAAAFDAGLGAASGNVICLLDADDLALPTRASAVVAALDAHPGSGWCFHRLRLVDTAGEPLPDQEPDGAISGVDWRPHAARGRIDGVLPMPLPATSGMALDAELAARLRPLPRYPGIQINDAYVKYACLAACPGVMVDRAWGDQRIHDRNLLTRAAGQPADVALVDATTALELRRHGLGSDRFCGNLVAFAFELVRRSGLPDPPARAVIAEYLAESSARERSWIAAKRVLYRARAARRSDGGFSSLPRGVAGR